MVLLLLTGKGRVVLNSGYDKKKDDGTNFKSKTIQSNGGNSFGALNHLNDSIDSVLYESRTRWFENQSKSTRGYANKIMKHLDVSLARQHKDSNVHEKNPDVIVSILKNSSPHDKADNKVVIENVSDNEVVDDEWDELSKLWKDKEDEVLEFLEAKRLPSKEADVLWSI